MIQDMQKNFEIKKIKRSAFKAKNVGAKNIIQNGSAP